GNDIVFDASTFPSSSNQKDRNKLILSLINLFDNNKIEWNDDLPIVLDKNNNFQFEEDREDDIKTLKSRDMLRLNKYATAEDCMNALTEKYQLEAYSKSDARKIASVCYEMRANSFNTANPYTFAADVDEKIASVIMENSNVYKGVKVQVSTYREYTDGTIAPHILGTTGQIDAEEYRDLKKDGYAMDDIIGKSGIESEFEKNLKGTNGTKIVSTATDGSQTVESKELKNGDNIILTIDSKLQKVAQDSLAETCKSFSTKNAGGGAVVVMNCNTGEILAIASYPSYNLSTYKDDYKKLAADTKHIPLFNRALQSTYSPGSTAKVSTALACLEEKIITENTTKVCTGNYEYLGHTFKCQIEHDDSDLNVKTALQDSCNTFFFYYGGEKLGVEKLNMYREILGLGQKTGVELYESAGILDSPSYRTSIGQTWQPGYSLLSAIGEAGNQFTPIQLCNYAATIANGGTRYKAHLIKSILSSDNSKVILNKEPEVIHQAGFSQINLNIVKAGMRLVVTNGTCNEVLGQLSVPVACKTGTSEVQYYDKGKTTTYTNGFNISFAPYDKPEIAVAVAIEGGTSGAGVAPVARAVYN
ncbi:MAG: hypothetical protein KBT46_01325, partial [Ruminococcus sp.]|nr:hypothetical protein [Candidatus Copronaster equi]